MSVPHKAGQWKRLLAEDVPNTQQADAEIHEDQFHNFLINTLTGAFSLNFGENADIDAEGFCLRTL